MTHIRWILGVAAACAAAGSAWADTLRVPQDHTTIQAAVDAAGDGDVIVVAKGRYEESVTVGKTNLEIRGAGHPVIAPPSGGNGLTLSECSNVTVRDLVVDGGQDGIHVVDSSDITIEKCTVRDTDGRGIQALLSSRVHVVKCTVSGANGDSILFGDGVGSGVNGGDITKCRVKDGDDDGINVAGTDILVSKCSVDKVSDDGFDCDGDTSSGIVFEKCRLRRAGDECFEINAPGTVFRKCSAQDGEEEGFDIEANDVRLESCTVTKTRRGIEVSAGFARAAIVSCKVNRVSDDGVFLEGALDATVEKCVVVRPGESGFHLDAACTGNTLTGNKAVKSEQFDLEDESADGANTFTGNKFRTTGP